MIPATTFQFGRGRLYRVLALLAFALAIFALASPLIPAFSTDTSLRIPALTGAIGLLAAFLLLRSLCRSTISVQYLIMVPVIGIILGVVSGFLTPRFVVPASIITALAAAYAFIYEQGLLVEITGTGVVQSARYPISKQVVINWEEIESVTADLLSITTRFAGESLGMTDQKNKLVLQGKGRTITLGTPPYRLTAGGDPGDQRWIAAVYSRMAPAAINWTVKQVRSRGSVKLGPVEITPDVVSVSKRLGGKVQIRFADLRQVDLQAGYLLFNTDASTTRVSLRNVPNGLYLPEILQAAGWRGQGSEQTRA